MEEWRSKVRKNSSSDILPSKTLFFLCLLKKSSEKQANSGKNEGVKKKTTFFISERKWSEMVIVTLFCLAFVLLIPQVSFYLGIMEHTLIRIYASDEEIPQMGEYALCVHLKRNLKIFADFETKQCFFFWLSLVCQNHKYWLRSE